ncbi:polyamine aminopropyltransferase [Desulfonema magnum]|uniref:Polyamine aminopropyltransferase n=1 Tax=Desulfonema magnum TaxID=45655 RepID=A0A975BQD6_9BACT|nr:polyamine aminopropyltransferase [Desulfonema magnum]QTA89761.1 Polyamine aminopropyltransferase [Desulfonema magnum]
MDTSVGLELWVKEIHQNTTGLSFKVEKTLFSGQSRFQKVDIVQTYGHGIMLLNDGIIMLSERDEFIYHEMIAHVPLFVHPSPKQVLVIGGGDGGTVREIMKHPGVERVVMVEIDELVVNACRTHLSSVSCEMDNPRVELCIEDGTEYVDNTQEIFDVVIVDSTDPVGPGAVLFSRPFYEKISAILGPDGIMITQAESPFYDHDIQRTMLLNQRPFFKKLQLYLFSTLTYPGGLWSFGYASKGICPIGDFDPDRVETSDISTRYYNPKIHIAAFALPNFVSENLEDILDPIVIPFQNAQIKK